MSTYEVVLSRPRVPSWFPGNHRVRKKKEKTLVPSDFLVGPVSLDGATVRFSLEAKPTGSLRADAFARELVRETVVAGHASEDLRPITFLRVDQRAADGQ